jgi:hypothetical protein
MPERFAKFDLLLVGLCGTCGRETKDDEMMCKTYRRKTAQD